MCRDQTGVRHSWAPGVRDRDSARTLQDPRQLSESLILKVSVTRDTNVQVPTDQGGDGTQLLALSVPLTLDLSGGQVELQGDIAVR